MTKGPLSTKTARLRSTTQQVVTLSAEQSVVPDEMALTEQSAVLERFIAAINAGTRPETDVTDNLRSIRTVFAAVEAVEWANSARPAAGNRSFISCVTHAIRAQDLV